MDRSVVAVRLTADIVWEDAPRRPFSLFYETDGAFAGDLDQSADAFLCSVAISASRDRERRILLDRPVCPRLARGVANALSILKRWYPGSRTLPRLESRGDFRRDHGPGQRAALCLTGGVDSLHTLWRNRREHSPRDPRFFRRAVYVVHLSFPPGDALPRARDVAQRQLEALKTISREMELDLCAIRTNVRAIEPELSFSQAEGLASLLSAAGHFGSRGIGTLSIASSSYDSFNQRPWGTHPLLDSNFSSAGLQVIHEDAGMPRTEKVRNIARWELARRNLFVCFEGPLADGRANCGRCEKCLRTMTAWLAVGGGDAPEAFGGSSVTPEAILQMPLSYDPNEFPYLWSPLAASMEETGRRELALAIRRRLAEARRYLRWRDERDWKGAARKLDRRLLGGWVTSTSRRIRGLSGPPEIN
ncbi:MAG: hypothetical protein ACRD16_13775 [Thermoanaerobaculia bacterium]